MNQFEILNGDLYSSCPLEISWKDSVYRIFNAPMMSVPFDHFPELIGGKPTIQVCQWTRSLNYINMDGNIMHFTDRLRDDIQPNSRTHKKNSAWFSASRHDPYDLECPPRLRALGKAASFQRELGANSGTGL